MAPGMATRRPDRTFRFRFLSDAVSRKWVLYALAAMIVATLFAPAITALAGSADEREIGLADPDFVVLLECNDSRSIQWRALNCPFPLGSYDVLTKSGFWQVLENVGTGTTSLVWGIYKGLLALNFWLIWTALTMPWLEWFAQTADQVGITLYNTLFVSFGDETFGGVTTSVTWWAVLIMAFIIVAAWKIISAKPGDPGKGITGAVKYLGGVVIWLAVVAFLATWSGPNPFGASQPTNCAQYNKINTAGDRDYPTDCVSGFTRAVLLPVSILMEIVGTLDNWGTGAMNAVSALSDSNPIVQGERGAGVWEPYIVGEALWGTEDQNKNHKAIGGASGMFYSPGPNNRFRSEHFDKGLAIHRCALFPDPGGALIYECPVEVLSLLYPDTTPPCFKKMGGGNWTVHVGWICAWDVLQTDGFDWDEPPWSSVVPCWVENDETFLTAEEEKVMREYHELHKNDPNYVINDALVPGKLRTPRLQYLACRMLQPWKKRMLHDMWEALHWGETADPSLGLLIDYDSSISNYPSTKLSSGQSIALLLWGMSPGSGSDVNTEMLENLQFKQPIVDRISAGNHYVGAIGIGGVALLFGFVAAIGLLLLMIYASGHILVMVMLTPLITIVAPFPKFRKLSIQWVLSLVRSTTLVAGTLLFVFGMALVQDILSTVADQMPGLIAVFVVIVPQMVLFLWFPFKLFSMSKQAKVKLKARLESEDVWKKLRTKDGLKALGKGVGDDLRSAGKETFGKGLPAKKLQMGANAEKVGPGVKSVSGKRPVTTFGQSSDSVAPGAAASPSATGKGVLSGAVSAAAGAAAGGAAKAAGVSDPGVTSAAGAATKTSGVSDTGGMAGGVAKAAGVGEAAGAPKAVGAAQPGVLEGGAAPGTDLDVAQPGVVEGGVAPGTDLDVAQPGVGEAAGAPKAVGAAQPGVLEGGAAPGTDLDVAQPGVLEGGVAPGTDLDVAQPGVVESGAAPGTDLDVAQPGVLEGGAAPGTDLDVAQPGVVESGVQPGTDLDVAQPGVVEGGVQPGVDLDVAQPGVLEGGAAKAAGVSDPGVVGADEWEAVAPIADLDVAQPGEDEAAMPGTTRAVEAPRPSGLFAEPDTPKLRQEKKTRAKKSGRARNLGSMALGLLKQTEAGKSFEATIGSAKDKAAATRQFSQTLQQGGVRAVLPTPPYSEEDQKVVDTLKARQVTQETLLGHVMNQQRNTDAEEIEKERIAAERKNFKEKHDAELKEFQGAEQILEKETEVRKERTAQRVERTAARRERMERGIKDPRVTARDRIESEVDRIESEEDRIASEGSRKELAGAIWGRNRLEQILKGKEKEWAYDEQQEQWEGGGKVSSAVRKEAARQTLLRVPYRQLTVNQTKTLDDSKAKKLFASAYQSLPNNYKKVAAEDRGWGKYLGM